MSQDDTSSTGPAVDPGQTAAFEALIAGRSAAVQDLARAGRALVLAVLPEVVESVWPRQGTASYGIGPKKMSEHFVYFTFAKAHIGFGFYRGAGLPDPEQLLQGTGKKMRRVVIGSLADLERPALRDLVEASVRDLGSH